MMVGQAGAPRVPSRFALELPFPFEAARATKPMPTIKTFVAEFRAITGLVPSFDADYEACLKRLVAYLASKTILPAEHRKRRFLGHVNWKFRLNAEPLGAFYALGAKHGFTFNYHQKCSIQRAFDEHDAELLEHVLREREVPAALRRELRAKFLPVPWAVTLDHLKSEHEDPTKLRREKGERDIAGEIMKAQFSAFMWASLPEREMHAFFDPYFNESEYRESFWEQLHTRAPHLFNRSHALHILNLGQAQVEARRDLVAFRDQVFAQVRESFAAINNYGFLAVLLEPLQHEGRDVQWELAADITLFAEKHKEVRIANAYFRHARVRAETERYLPQVAAADPQFEVANEGFTYRDCFVLSGVAREPEKLSLLLVFQKNERDETPVQCPTCRSEDVQGNSYPTLGVRSWECNNPLCPDRSKYNRGKRYSFKGLAMQQAIDDERNEIPADLVRKWSRDVLAAVSRDDVLEMLVRHYSMHGDSVHLFDWPKRPRTLHGRSLHHHALGKAHPGLASAFWVGAYFRRYVHTRPGAAPAQVRNLGTDDFQVLLGDACEVLRSLPEGTFDGAVTSPPYYNAREYAQWDNIYGHLYDMYNVGREVFRTLKPGALYYYNVFDYFDNENNIVFSAMGQRRMLLSAYTVDLFRRAGLECVGNVVWDKGEIEGKRGFNAGNFSPYYQAPFNCWEHVLVFRKPDGRAAPTFTSHVMREKPVIKMVRGQNTHGHSAPFPDAIPELLVRQLPQGARVLDPFGGSLTTGRVAARHGLRSTCIERSEEYCKLGLRMYAEEQAASAGKEARQPEQQLLFARTGSR